MERKDRDKAIALFGIVVILAAIVLAASVLYGENLTFQRQPSLSPDAAWLVSQEDVKGQLVLPDGQFDRQGYFTLAELRETPPLAMLGFSPRGQQDILRNHRPVHVAVGADWCEPCRSLDHRYSNWHKPYYYQHYDAYRHAPILRSLRIAIAPVPRLIVWLWRRDHWIRVEYFGVSEIEGYIKTLGK